MLFIIVDCHAKIHEFNVSRQLSPDIINHINDFFYLFRNCFLVSWFSNQDRIIPIICKEQCLSSGCVYCIIVRKLCH
jgi:hypothetical protein